MNSKPNSRSDRLAYSSEKNQRIYEFIKSQPVGILATVGLEGKPHAAVIYYSVDDNFNFTFVTKRDTTKCKNLDINPNAMLVVYEARTQTTVQVVARAEVMTDRKSFDDAYHEMRMAAMITSEAGVPPLAKLESGGFVAYRLKPSLVNMAVFMRPESGNDSLYETIDLTLMG